MRSRAHGRRSGLTLIDLAIALLILAVAGAIAAPRFVHMLARYRVEAAAGRVRADLEYARQHARAQGQPRTVAFDLSRHSYQLADVEHPDRPGAAYVVSLADSAGAVSIKAAAFGADAEPQVTFDLYGRPAGAGSVVLTSGGWEQTVRVDGTTGRVTIE